jgi:hypothetical protein
MKSMSYLDDVLSRAKDKATSTKTADDAAVEAKVKEAFDLIPTILTGGNLPEEVPLLKIRHDDEVAAKAGTRIVEALAGRGVRAKIKANPYMMDMSRLVMVDVGDLTRLLDRGS